MSHETPGPSREERLLKLDQVQVVTPANILDAYVIIPWNRKTASCSSKATKLFADVSEANNEGRSPTKLLLANSETQPPDLIGIPSSQKHDHSLKMTWSDQGQTLNIKMDKLLAARNITIPRGTRMFISVYEDTDRTFGKVVGIRINSAVFHPIRYLTEEEKAARAQKKQEREKAKQDAKARAQEQAVAEQPPAESTEAANEAE